MIKVVRSLLPIGLLLGGLSANGQDVSVVTGLEPSLSEISGILTLNERLIGFTDSGGSPHLYEIDTLSGTVSRSVHILNTANIDWEAICSDGTYIFIGDIGNNNGNRDDLSVYRISIEDYLATPNDTVSAEVIEFVYADQTDFSSSPFATNFDAEAMVAVADSLYIFSKNWLDSESTIYALPKEPGSYIAGRGQNIPSNGLVTDADYDSATQTVILVGHSFLLQPFVVLLSDFAGSTIAPEAVNRISFQGSSGYSTQVEGIQMLSSQTFFATAEEGFNGSAALYRVRFSSLSLLQAEPNDQGYIYPNPTSGDLKLSNKNVARVEIYASSGQLVNTFPSEDIMLDSFESGTYIMKEFSRKGELIITERLVIRR